MDELFGLLFEGIAALLFTKGGRIFGLILLLLTLSGLWWYLS